MKLHNKKIEDEILGKLLASNSTHFIEELFKSSDIQSLLTPRILTEFLVLPIDESGPKEQQIVFTDHLIKLNQEFLYTILTPDNLINVLATMMDVRNAYKTIQHLPRYTFDGIKPESLGWCIQALPLLAKLTSPISDSLDDLEKYDLSVQTLLKKTYCSLPSSSWDLDSFIKILELVTTHPILRIVLDHIATIDAILFGTELPLKGFYVEDSNTLVLNLFESPNVLRNIPHLVSTFLHEGVHALLSQRFDNKGKPYGPNDKREFDNILHTIYREYISVTKNMHKDKDFIPFVPSTELGKQQVYATGILTRNNEERSSEVFPHFIQEIFDAEILQGKCNISCDLAKLLWDYFITKICQIKQIIPLPENLHNENLFIEDVPNAMLESFLQLLVDKPLDVTSLSNPYYAKVLNILPYDIRIDYYEQVWNTLDGETIVQFMNIITWANTFIDMSSTLSAEKLNRLLTEGNMVKYISNIKCQSLMREFVDKIFPILKPQTLQDIFNLQVMEGMDSIPKSYIQSKLDQLMHQISDHSEFLLQENTYLTAIIDHSDYKVEIGGNIENH